MKAFLERLVSPGYGTCWRCHRPWRFVKPHIVTYEWTEHTRSGAFALCEGCWAESDQYMRRWAMHDRHPGYDWDALMAREREAAA